MEREERRHLIDCLRGKERHCRCMARSAPDCCCSNAVWPSQVADKAADELERMAADACA